MTTEQTPGGADASADGAAGASVDASVDACEDGAAPDLAGQLLARARANAPAAAAATRARPRSSRRGRRANPPAGDYSGARPDDRDPQPVGSVVDDLVDERGWTQPLAIGGVEGRWPQIVGADVASHCAPEQFEAGRLTVRTDSTAWATQIRLLAPTLLARLNDDLGAGTVTHLQVLGPRGPSWRKGKLRVKDRGPRDTYG